MILTGTLFGQSAPEIDCIPSAFANPIIQWTEPGDVCGSFTIFVSTNGGPYTSLATLPSGTATSYQHIGADGINNVLSYYIQCDADPTLISDTVSNERLINPTITSVTMLSNTQVEITWEEGVSPTTAVYRVYESVNGSLIATQRGSDINGVSNTSFIYTYPSPIENPVNFTVTALNSCFQNENLPTPPNGYHSSIFLNLETDRCNAALNLNWTNYIGWDSTEYEVLVNNITAGTNTIIPVGRDTSYVLQNIVDGEDYNIKIQGVSLEPTNNRVAPKTSSNDTSLKINIVTQPAYVYLANASVHDDGVELTYYTDKTADIRTFEVYRKYGIRAWEKLWEEKVPLPQGVSPLDLSGRLSEAIIRKDRSADICERTYQYQVRVLDSCRQSFSSNIATAMLLEGNAGHDYINSLNWPHYEEWDNGVNQYDIYRQLDSLVPWENINNTPDSTYENDIESETIDPDTRDYDGIFNYRVHAQNVPTARDIEYGIDSIESMSCPLSLVQWPPFLSAIPNAFTPNGDGLNDTFKPHMVFLRKEGYEMVIINRWGHEIFKTNEPTEGWNGQFNFQNSPQGVYQYSIQFYLPDPNDPSVFIRKLLTGSLMLMR